MGSGTSTSNHLANNASGRMLQQTLMIHGDDSSRAAATFNMVDKDTSGAIDKDEFCAAAHAVGLPVSDEELTAVFLKYDADGNGTINQEEFIQFFEEKQSSFYDEDQATVDKLSADGLKSIIPYLGPSEASRGFRKAHLILKKNPSAASAKLSATNPMRPLHILLNLDAPLQPPGEGHGRKSGCSSKAKGASQAAATAAAVPLIEAVLKCDPEGAKVRTGQSEGLPDGRLPLHTALEKRWPLPVIQALVEAYPEGAATVDATKMKKGARVAPSLKTGRWARKIAEDSSCPLEVIALLPMPKGKKEPFDWLSQEQIDALPAKKGKKAK